MSTDLTKLQQLSIARSKVATAYTLKFAEYELAHGEWLHWLNHGAWYDGDESVSNHEAHLTQAEARLQELDRELGSLKIDLVKAVHGFRAEERAERRRRLKG